MVIGGLIVLFFVLFAEFVLFGFGFDILCLRSIVADVFVVIVTLRSDLICYSDLHSQAQINSQQYYT